MNNPKKRKELNTESAKFKGKKKKKYRLKFEIKVYLVLLFASLIFVVLSFTLLFRIKNIYVNGCDIYDNEKIINISGIKKGSNLLLCNKSDVIKNISKTFPYIEKVKILKKIPNSVEINIEIAHSDFAVENKGEYFYISEKGRILEKTNIKPENLLIIRGIKIKNSKECEQIEYNNPDIKKIIQDIRINIQNNNLNKIIEINLTDLNRIVLNYDNRIDLLIGSLDKFDYKILTAKEIIENKIGKSEKGTLNLSELDKDNKSYFMQE